MSRYIDPNVLLATAHIQASLLALPRLIGPKKIWVPWFWDGLHSDMADPASPLPRLLGSLFRVLHYYYTGGTKLDDFCMSEVRWDDNLVTGDRYVDISPDMLPELTGEYLWWQRPPPSVFLRDSQSPPLSGSLAAIELSPPRGVGEESGIPSIHEDIPISLTGSVSGYKRGRKRKGHVTTKEYPRRSSRKKARAISNDIRHDCKNDAECTPSTVSAPGEIGDDHVPTDEEAELPICDDCKMRVFCVWPSKLFNKSACTTCTSYRVRCLAGGVPVHGRRRKQAELQDYEPDTIPDQIIQGMKHVEELKKNAIAARKERKELHARLANLEVLVAELVEEYNLS